MNKFLKIILILNLFFFNINVLQAKETVTLSSCIDGDTFKITINKEKYTIRLLAIDTPESVHPTKAKEYYGEESSNYTCNLLTNAKTIELEYDNNSTKTDKYNRLLAWVFVDNKLLQDLLITNGYAKVAYLYNNYKYTNILQEHEKEAQSKKVGIWSQEQQFNYEPANYQAEDKSSHQEKIFNTIILIIIIILIIKDKIKTKKSKKHYS